MKLFVYFYGKNKVDVSESNRGNKWIYVYINVYRKVLFLI